MQTVGDFARLAYLRGLSLTAGTDDDDAYKHVGFSLLAYLRILIVVLQSYRNRQHTARIQVASYHMHFSRHRHTLSVVESADCLSALRSEYG
jgi:hypothetical protein